MPEESAAKLYVNSMARIRQRIDLVTAILDRSISLGAEVFETELVYLQFRKVLEEIAFSSLIANREQYAELHTNFSNHWKAEKILQTVENINPKFYPQPLQKVLSAPGTHHFDPIKSAFLTREEFACLYDISSQVLHTRNPYSSAQSVIQAKYSGHEWVSRILRLLSLHSVQLVNGEILIVNIPPTGPIHFYHASPGIDLDPSVAEENRRDDILLGWRLGHEALICSPWILTTNLKVCEVKISSSRSH
jgi:hypothetical protein